MIKKIINVILCIIIFVVPIVVIPAFRYFNIPKIVVLLICGFTLLVLLFLKRKELKFDSIDKVLLIFYALIVLSTIFSIKPLISIIGWQNRWEGLLTFTTYFLTYYCAKYYFSYNDKIKKFAITIVCICSIIGILQYYNIFPLYYIFNIPHIPGYSTSTFGNSNFFGNFIAMAVTIFMALYIVKGNKSYLIVSFISFMAMITSMARSAWVGFAIASVVGFIYIIKNISKDIIKRTVYMLLGFILIFVFILKPPQSLIDILPKGANISGLSNRIDLIGSELETAIGER